MAVPDRRFTAADIPPPRVFYTKVHNRLLRPLMAADQAQAPPGLRQALRAINQHVDDYITRARLGKAA